MNPIFFIFSIFEKLLSRGISWKNQTSQKVELGIIELEIKKTQKLSKSN